MGTLWLSFFARAHVRKNKVCAGIVGLLLAVNAMSAQTENADLALPAFDLEAPQTKTVQVGDQLHLKVSGFSFAEAFTVSPTAEENLDSEGWGLNSEPGKDVSVAPLKPGKITLPSLIIRDAQGKALARTNPFTVEVQTAIRSDDPSPEKPNDIAPPVGLQFPYWVVAALIFLALAAMGALAYGVFRLWKKRKPKTISRVEPQIPEDERALRDLNELAAENCYKNSKVKRHYFRISEILKIYIGARYRFDAQESTTREMLEVLESKQTQLLEPLEEAFIKLDRVKFTDYYPEENESLDLLNFAKEFVHKTKKVKTILPAEDSATGLTGVKHRAL